MLSRLLLVYRIQEIAGVREELRLGRYNVHRLSVCGVGCGKGSCVCDKERKGRCVGCGKGRKERSDSCCLV